ncbi:hypothetical protein NQ318_011776 [Aromia moschata]|uniref:DNA repair protein SWI5 homolog n=1 Tax=Aromia moschata TaxID=1265417 RepID=A0AAV8Y0G5_9CUCU|nr:hypothetical protein NQ318_011776 [Aromia moschata]
MPFYKCPKIGGITDTDKFVADIDIQGVPLLIGYCETTDLFGLKYYDLTKLSLVQKLLARYEKLLKENSQLDKEIADLVSKGVTADLQPQMQALHEYNEMKDLTQLVLGYLADAENVTVSDLHRRYDLPTE